MILQIDHIAISSDNLDGDIYFWERLGYKLQFSEKNLKNLVIKKKFLSYYQESHQLALLSNPKNYSIEVLNHGKIKIKAQIIFPIFQNFPTELILKRKRLKKIIGFNLEEFIFKHYNLNGYILKEKSNRTIKFNKIIIKVSRLQESIKFWSLLGFKFEKKENNIALLKFRSILKNEDYIIILDQRVTSAKQKVNLNDQGFNCIALISNSTKEEKDLLKSNNFFTTDIKQLEVNDFIFNLFFAKGPSNENVEILSPT